jgi:hypothetical protein
MSPLTSRSELLFVSRLLEGRRREMGTRTGTRALLCWKQAVFVSAWLARPRQLPARRWIDGLDTRQHGTAPYATRLHVIDVTQMS